MTKWAGFPAISQVNYCSQLNCKHELKARIFPVVCSMPRRSRAGRTLVLKTKLNSNSAGTSKGKKCETLVWYHKDLLPHTGWSIVKLFSKGSNCQLVSDATRGVCKMKPDTSENSLNDWGAEPAYSINRFPCSASNPNVPAAGRRASSPKPAPAQQLSPLAAPTRGKGAESRAGGWSGPSLLITQWGDQMLCKLLFSCVLHTKCEHTPHRHSSSWLCCQRLTYTCSLSSTQTFYVLG